MASLAPGNGWLPHRGCETPRLYAVRSQNAPLRLSVARAGSSRPAGNVFTFPSPGAGPHLSRNSQPGYLDRWISRWAIDANAPDDGVAGPRSNLVLTWCVLGVASMAWMGLLGALCAGAIALGVSWALAVTAFGSAHLLAAALVGIRISRALAATELRRSSSHLVGESRTLKRSRR